MGNSSQRSAPPPGPDGPSPFRLAGIGMELVVPLLVGIFGGRWLDRRFGTGPWLLLAGAILGAAAGMLGVYRQAVRPR